MHKRQAPIALPDPSGIYFAVISVFVRALFDVSMGQGVIADNLPLQLLPLGLQDLDL